MHLYLSSFQLGNRASELAALVTIKHVAVVVNALDHTDPRFRRRVTQEQVSALAALGFDVHELDLRHYFGDQSGLAGRLEGVGLVWVAGGNVFLLRRAMRQSRLDEYLITRKASPSLVYGGFSAGACVTAPTLRGCEMVDMVDATADGYDPDLIWDGLGLLPYSIAPHFQSDHPDSAQVDAMVEYFTRHHVPFVTLQDGEVLITAADDASAGDGRTR